MGLAVMTLQLRQQRLELNYKVSQLHRQVEAHQARLWNQQLQVAVYTAPNAIAHTVSNNDLHLVPRAPLMRGQTAATWSGEQDAE
jgi:cell division protein FtsL